MLVSHMRRRSALALVASVSVFAFGASARAADASSDTGVTVEELIVTAQHRDENLQNVPISISVLSAKTLENSGFQSVTDLQYLVPGVQYDPTQGAAFQIRGVGSTSFDFSNAKSVSVVVDDVVIDAQRENGLTGLSDIQRVDVLMGPQGTLFGKNSTSGVISVTTADPVLNQWSGKAYANYGERNDHGLNGTLNLPIGQDAALRVTAFEQGQNGPGWYTVVHKHLGSFEDYGARGKLLYRPTDTFEALLSADYQHHWDSSIRTAVSGAPAIVTAAELANGVTPGPENPDSADTSVGAIVTSSQGASLRVKAKFGADTLTSITAWRGTTYDNDTPADLVPGNIYAYIPYNQGRLETSKVSQELRWASPTGQFFEYVGGLFYNKLIADQTQLQWATLGAPLVSATGVKTSTFYALTGAIGAPGNISLFMARNTTTAAFGQVKFNFSDKLNLALGGRYTSDHNSQGLSYPYVDPLPITGVAAKFIATSAQPFKPQGSVDGHNFSYRISPQYKLNDNVMLYATYSTGYKPAGIAFVGNKYDPYRAETVKSIEIGEKAELFDRRLRLNVALFDEQFTDFQATVLTSIPGSVTLQAVIGNAGGLKSQGGEVTFALKPSQALSLNGSLTYTNAYFTDYVANPTTNYTDTRLTNAPRWAAFLGGDYEHEFSGQLLMKANLGYAYRSDIWTVVGQPSYSHVKGYGLLNGRVSFAPKSLPVEFGVYGRNLLNTYYSTGWQQYGALGLLHYTTPNAYRTVGVFFKYAY